MGVCSSCCACDGPGSGAENIAPISMSVNEAETPEPSLDMKPIIIPSEDTEQAPLVSTPPASTTAEASAPAVAEAAETAHTRAALVAPPPPENVPKKDSSSSDGKSPRRVPTPASPIVRPKRTGDEGWYLVFSHTSQGTLQGRYCQRPPAGAVLISRPDVPFDEGLFFQSPVELGRNMKADWMLQAKATCQWLRTAAQHKGEIEVKAEFFDALPRKSMIVFHHEDGKITTIRSPIAFDTTEKPVDAVSIIPLGADVYKGFTSLKTHVFLERGVRKGATLKLVKD